MTATVVEQIINRLLVGSYYIVALGLSVIFSLGGVVNPLTVRSTVGVLRLRIQKFAGFGGAVVLSPSASPSVCHHARSCSAFIARTRCWGSCSLSASR
jgi:hypothetical protein